MTFIDTIKVSPRGTRNTSPTCPRLDNLSPARTALLEVFRQLGFGRLENLEFRNGEPVLDGPRTRVVRTLRFADGEDAGPVPSLIELTRRPAIRSLLSHINKTRDGKFNRLEIRAASPVFCELELGPRDGEVAHA